jgi:hypothetical protein
MSASDRQNRLLVAEDWKRIYQSYQNADFQSYDFENLRRVMIQYIRENYPEDFNDYIESSEYLALIDLMAFLGQSISFRIDLNARDNFLELAERRESVLRLSRLLGYKSKRNLAATGLLKFTTVQTSQQIFDSNGRNISNQVISWNDPTNPNWYDQFIKIINAAMPSTRQFGNSEVKDTVYGIPTESYRFQTTSRDVPIFEFNKTVDGKSMNFEIVSTTFSGRNEIYEEPPLAANPLAFIYRDDGRGNASSNTGFFLMFKEGTLNQGTFTLSQPAPGEAVDIDVENINNTDIWLYKLNTEGNEETLWTQVPEIEGNNVIYNSLSKSIRNIYSVVTKASDRASLIFSDGVFGNLPQGTFKAYYRTSNGLSYTINPRDIRNISVSIPYISNTGQQERISLTLSLQTSVANSSPAETSESIKSRAPATFYTQNRMITAEDYNISPLSVNQDVVKVKAVNRSASGISRYFDLVDPTGKYSKTNLFADDGILYRQFYTDSIRFRYNTRTDIEAIIYNQVIDILKETNLKNFYYSNFDKIPLAQLQLSWINQTVDTNQSTGYIKDTNTEFLQKVGTFTSTLLSYFTIGTLVKFKPPAGYYFDKANNNKLKLINGPLPKNASTYIWSKVVNVFGDGTANNTGRLVNGSGPIVLNEIIPDPVNGLFPTIVELIPTWRSTIEAGTILAMTELIFSNKPFGLRYDTASRTWKIIIENNLNIDNVFSLGRQGDVSNQKLDSSWMLLFTTDTEFYTVKYRLARYIFESDKQVRFFFDSSDKIYDARNNTTVKDVIKILSINPDPASPGGLTPFTFDKNWEITEEFRGIDGYVDSKKIQITFNDSDDDGIVDDPLLFEEIVAPNISNEIIPLQDKYVIFEKYTISQGQEDYRYTDNSDEKVLIVENEQDARNIINSREETAFPINEGQYFYFVQSGIVKHLTNKGALSFSVTLDYRVFQGRDNLKFQYIHNADYESRIDPGVTNIVDIYLLTKQYDIVFRQWLSGELVEEPLPPSTDYLYNLLSPDLNRIKSLSDEIIYHPVKYKILFGARADTNVQAVFKITKNPEIVISDNDLKTQVLSAINEFFALENWEFGDNFYFSELSAYVVKQVAPSIVNFTIVPRQSDLVFGSLFEIKSEKDQIFTNGATIDDIEIIPTITASAIKSAGLIEKEQTVLVQQSITSSGSN